MDLGRQDFKDDPSGYIAEMILCPNTARRVMVETKFRALCKTAGKCEEIRENIAKIEARVQAKAEKARAEALLSALDLAAIQDAVSAPPTGPGRLKYGF
jgi:hypothetical protein